MPPYLVGCIARVYTQRTLPATSEAPHVSLTISLRYRPRYVRGCERVGLQAVSMDSFRRCDIRVAVPQISDCRAKRAALATGRVDNAPLFWRLDCSGPRSLAGAVI
ncbi:hypothetical protein EVAR_62246_1 [Eumeta japonica]|uniref:Uncharacterized protein n=1 Tax=Eumeta variegata TaxID=151549 RepID=A0A4C1ZBJ7_EUMVA|nr:hypothetical protein EVAR_62246_1 [Eumeta japonica]